MTSQRRSRFFSADNDQGRTLSTSSNSNGSSSSSSSSRRSPDLLECSKLESDSSLDGLPPPEVVMGHASYSGTPSRRGQTTSPTLLATTSMTDRSWATSTTSPSVSRSRRRPSGTLQVQRNHSGEGLVVPLHPHHSNMSTSLKSTERSYSANSTSSRGGPRHRSTASSNSHSSSPRLILQAPPKRNLSGGDFAADTYTHHALLSSSSLSMSGREPAQHHPQHPPPQGQLQLPYGNTNSPTNSFIKRRHYSNISSPWDAPSYYWKQGHHKQMIAFFGFLTLAILGIAVYQHDAMLQEALVLKEKQVHHHIEHAKELEKRVSALRLQNVQLEQQLENMPTESELDLETQRKLFHWEHANHKMQQDIQSWSQRLVREKYGHGPKYYVQMKLAFDPESNVYQDHPGDDVVIIETASIDDMPHSVFLFLEQIDHHLYDRSSFHRNSPHLIQAGPSNSPASHARFRHQPSLQAVIFQEYAPEMSHKQYTLGYSGRPGGPDFYVNMRDNSALHGPGGQHHPFADIARDADPCFAKIVRGFEAMERIHRAAVMDPATNDAIAHPIVIENIKVLPHDYRLPPSPSRRDSSSKEEEDYEKVKRRSSDHYLLEEEYVEDIL